MTRMRVVVAATIAALGFSAPLAFAQTTPGTTAQTGATTAQTGGTTSTTGTTSATTSVLAGKKFTPPLKGQAAVEFTAPQTVKSKDGASVITRITVRNISAAPIARLSIAETWYDKSGGVLTAGRGGINGLLQPGEIQTIEISTPWKLGMNANNYNFSHANGTVKPARVQKLEAPKPSATSSTTAKPATTATTAKPAGTASTAKPATTSTTTKPTTTTR